MVFNTSCTLIHLTKQGIGILLADEDDLERVNLMQDSTAHLSLQMRSWRTQHAVFDAELHSQEAEAWTCCMDNIRQSVQG